MLQALLTGPVNHPKLVPSSWNVVFELKGDVCHDQQHCFSDGQKLDSFSTWEEILESWSWKIDAQKCLIIQHNLEPYVPGLRRAVKRNVLTRYVLRLTLTDSKERTKISNKKRSLQIILRDRRWLAVFLHSVNYWRNNGTEWKMHRDVVLATNIGLAATYNSPAWRELRTMRQFLLIMVGHRRVNIIFDRLPNLWLNKNSS